MNKEIIKNKIESVKKYKYKLQIFKIIFDNDEQYINNNNGIFIDLNKLKEETINKIDEFIKTVETNDKNEISNLKSNFNNKYYNNLNLPRHERRLLKVININDI
jgi:hypothetical protein